jgi:hypothetical protein
MSSRRRIPEPRRGDAARLFLILALAALVPGRAPSAAEPEWSPAFEYQVKIGFVYNFTKFVEWPSQSFPDPGTPLTIGVLGSDPLGDALEQTLHGRTVNGRPVVVRHLRRADEIGGLHVLFVSPSLGAEVPRVLQTVRASPILTIGDMQRFNDLGGIINFKIEDHRVRFDINIDAARRAGLRLSSQLLSVATVVHDPEPGGGAP